MALSNPHATRGELNESNLLHQLRADEPDSDIAKGVHRNYRVLAGKEIEDDMPTPAQNKRVKVGVGMVLHILRLGRNANKIPEQTHNPLFR